MEHDEIVGLLKRPGRLRYASKQRDSEGLFDFVLVEHTTIERLGEEGERDSEDAAEQEAEDGIAPRSRPCLRRTLRRLKHARPTRHQLPDSCELTLLLNKRRVESRVGLPLGDLPSGGERLDPRLQRGEGLVDVIRSPLLAELRELRRISVGQAYCSRRVSILDGDPNEVRVGRRRYLRL